MDPLDSLVEQLWSPLVDTGGVRVDVDGADDPDWVDAESYWAVPDLRRARLLAPRGDRAVTAAAIENYRGLRLRRKNLMRAVVGPLARYGVPVLRDAVTLQVRRDRPELGELLPLAVLETALGRRDLSASIGIRTGDNRKASLALVDDRGRPVGHAKVGWDPVSDDYVRTETRVLEAIGGGSGPMRAPAVLAQTTYHDHPVLVMEPLPEDVRGSRGRIAPPTSDELYSLTPVTRRAAPRETDHLSRLAGRLRGLQDDGVAGDLATRAKRLLETVESRDDAFPVTARWHGDLTVWNRARDSSGQLWVWDWENSEDDAAAGLDPLHWAFSARRSPSAQLLEVDLPAVLDEARPHLTAAGVSVEQGAIVAALYMLVVVERACSLAAHHGDWSSVWISRQDLQTLVAQAEELTS
ncbi:MAG: hypothetical protein QM747_07325 [Nocardioides sp.]